MRLHLRVLSGLQIGDEAVLDPPGGPAGGLIGRGDGCALCLRDASVSRSHVELRWESDGWWVIQHSTRSATVVDGTNLTSGPIRLRTEGLLQVGHITLAYRVEQSVRQSEPEVMAEATAPATMINIRSKLPALQQTVLPQMTPLRPTEATASQAPPTLILRRPESPKPEWDQLRQERDLLRSQCDRLESDNALLRQAQEQQRREREQLAAELQRVSHELATKTESPAMAQHVMKPGSSLPGQALQLLLPFSESLEQASEALREGDAARARTLIREASFGLADLRDLFESSVA
jgi:hypothetical protein